MISDRPVYLFCHIPKCAGSTVKQFMQTNAPNSAIRAKRRHTFLRDFGGDFMDLERTNIDPETVDFIGGHSLSRSAINAFPGRPVRPIVLIRDPLSFAVSFYNHRNRGAARQNRGPVSFELYIKSLPKNPMIRFILTRYLGIGYPANLKLDSRYRFELVDRALSEFWFVGSWLYANELLVKISEEMHLNGPIGTKNAASGNRLMADDVPSHLAEEVRTRNAADQLLWERWRDAKWSGAPADIAIDLPGGDQLAYIRNEIMRQVTERYIKITRKRL